MPRESRRQSRDDSDRRKPDRERDRDQDRDIDRRRERDGHATDRYRESDSNNRTRTADFTSMPNPPYFTSMPPAAPHSPPRQYTSSIGANPQEHQRRRAPSNSSAGSSSSSSLLDISRHYPQSRYGGFLGTFFSAPSERRRRSEARRAARSSKRRTSFYFGGTGNSSSSSVNSDLAYGQGYIPKLRRRGSGGSNSFRYGAAVASSSGRPAKTRDAVIPDAPRRPDGPMRGKTDEEILEIGRQLSDLAHKQNKHDLKAAGYVKPTMLAAAAVGLGKYRKSRKEARSRGVGSSKVHEDSSSDQSDWEDASDDESDGADSVLAYGSVVSSVLRPNVTGSSSHGVGPYASGAGAAAAAALADPGRRSSVVDPRLFGPVNSLRGMINTPCGFGQDPHVPQNTYQTTADARRYNVEPSDRLPMREVYPVPTSDPARFDVDANSRQELPHRSRTSTVPLEQPIPKFPVSSKVYDAEKLEDPAPRDSRHGKDRDSHGVNGSTAAGFMAAAIGAAGAAALVSDRKEDRKDKKALRDHERERERERDRIREKEQAREREREREREPEREKDRRERDRDSRRRDKDSEKDKDGKKSKRDSLPSTKQHENDHKRHSRNDDEETPRKRRETEAEYYADLPSSSRRDRSKRDVVDPRSELSRSSNRDNKSYSSRDDRKEDKGKPVDRYDFNYNQGASTSKVNPFLYQVADGAFSTTELAAAEVPPGRPLTPNIITIDREPNFDDYEPYLPLTTSEPRLSRKDSFEIEERAQGSHDYSHHATGSHDYEEGEHEARSIYDQAKHATVPVAAAAVASAIAVEAERSRERRRDRYDDDGSRDRESWRRDTVQEEADRYYRQSVIARKIEEEQIRSQTPENDDAPQVKIVTPPEMHEQHKTVGPYDAPNADVRIDNQLSPTEARKFEKNNGKRKSNFKSRDPSCERDRPVLNLVFPTPIPSREPTPKVEKQSRRGQPQSQARSDPSPEVVIGPKGDLIKAESSNKSVSWGENSTKSFEVESADGRSDAEREKVDEREEKPRARLSRASPWGIIAAAVAGSSSEPSGEPDTVARRESGKEDFGSKVHDSPDISGVGPEQVYTVDTRDQPPVPGPKPTNPTRTTLPGSFADDIEFAATLAAGLKDTGFDSNIVVDDPTYRRRDSPPGTREANGDEWNNRSMSDIVMDIANKKESSRSVVSEPGGLVRDKPANGDNNIEHEWEAPKKLSKKDKKKLDKLKHQSLDLGESSTPSSSETIVPDSTETTTFEDAIDDSSKLSKKEQKRREKQAKALALLEGESHDTQPQPDPAVVERSLPTEGVADNTFEDSAGKKKKKNRKSQDAAPEDIVTVPSDAFDDLQSLRKSDKDDAAVDDWDTPSKSKRKSKSDRDEAAPPRSAAESEISTSSKKSSKSKRRSGTEADLDGYGSDASKKSSKSKRRSAVEGEDGYGSDASKKSGKSKRRSTVEGEDGYGSDRSRKSSKSKRRSGTEGDFDSAGDVPSRSRSIFDDRDVSSVVSEGRADGRRREREKDRDRDKERDRDGRSSSKRSSRNYDDDDDARSVVSVASAPGGIRKSKEHKRSSGLFASIFRRDEDKKEKESFLDNAGTLGAGVGLAGAAAIVAAGVSRSNATDRFSEANDDDTQRASQVGSYDYDTFDPEIAPRAIKPAIDPQYGDLLPLPPSEPGSPGSEPSDLPALPDSRPNTPPEEHGMRRDQMSHRRRRSTQETPAKSPSRTAIPISLRLGQRTPVSPSGTFRSPPATPTPSGTIPDSAAKRASRGTSWDSSREIKPLYLLEHSRHGSGDTLVKQDDLPALPPSLSASEISLTEDNLPAGIGSSGLHIDTQDLPPSVDQHGGSQESTPKAEVKSEFQSFVESGAAVNPDEVDSMSKDRSSYLLNSTPSSTKTTATMESESTHRSNDEMPDIMEDLASADERFEDAVDVQFADSRRWSEDSTTMQDAQEQHDSQLEPELLARDVPAPATEPVAAEPDEWAGLSVKQRKKLKKAKRNQPLELGETSARELITESAPEPAAEPASEPTSALESVSASDLAVKPVLESPTEPAAESVPEPLPVVEHVPPFDLDLEPAAERASEKAPEPESDPAPTSAPEASTEPGLAPESTPGPDFSLESSSVEAPGSVADVSTVVEDVDNISTPDQAREEPPKGKKGKKKKKKSQTWEDDVVDALPVAAALAGAAALATGAASSRESASEITPEVERLSPSEVPQSPPAETHGVSAKVEDLVTDAQPDIAEAADSLARSTRKSKKKSKKGQQLEPLTEVDSTSACDPSTELASEGNTARDDALSTEEAATDVTVTEAEPTPESQPGTVEATVADAEDEWSTTPTSKRDKKSKKKKSIALDDALAKPHSVAEAVEETPIVTENEEVLTAEPESMREALQDIAVPTETRESHLPADELATEIVQINTEASSEPQFDKADAVIVDADEGSTASKKKKKNKKRRSVGPDVPDVPTELQPEAETVQETSIAADKSASVEDTPLDIDAEQAQLEVAADVPNKLSDAKAVNADDFLSTPAASKRNQKRKKKKTAVLLDDTTPSEEPATTTDEQSQEVVDAQIDPVLDKAPAVEETHDQPAVSEEQKNPESLANPEEEKFAAVGEDKIKPKKKKRKSVQFEPEPEIVTLPLEEEEEVLPPEIDLSETGGTQGTAATPILETQDTVLSAQDPVFEEVQYDASADTTQTDSQPPTDDWSDSPASKKKGKKGKKNRQVWSPTEELAPDSQDTSSADRALDDPTLASTSAEFDNKSGVDDMALAALTTDSNTLDVIDDVATATDTTDVDKPKTDVESEDEWSRLISGNRTEKLQDETVLVSHLTEEPEAVADISDKQPEALELEAKKDLPALSEPVEEWPLATATKGKKGKKNKKSRSLISGDAAEPQIDADPQLDTAAVTETPAETILELESVAQAIDAAEVGAPRDTTDAMPVVPAAEGPVIGTSRNPATDDADSIFPNKKDKKDKKKKKKQAALHEPIGDVPKEATEAETATSVDEEQPVRLLDDVAEPSNDIIADQTNSIGPTLESPPETEPTPVQQDEVEPNEEGGGSMTKTSKKDKKKKKKQASVEEPHFESTEDVPPTEAVPLTTPIASEPEILVEAALQPDAEPESPETEQPSPDEFPAKSSKKEKKKKKKTKQTVSEVAEAAATGPIIPVLEPRPEVEDLDTAMSVDRQSDDVEQPQADIRPVEESLSEVVAIGTANQDRAAQLEPEVVSTEPQPESTTQPAFAAEPEDERGNFSTKPSKKDKKKKKNSASEAVSQTPEAMSVKATVIEEMAEQTTEATISTNLSDLSETSAETATLESTVEDDPVGFSTKTSKKDRKNKKKPMSDVVPPLDETSAEPAVVQSVETTAPHDAVEEKDFAEPSTKPITQDAVFQEDEWANAHKEDKPVSEAVKLSEETSQPLVDESSAGNVTGARTLEAEMLPSEPVMEAAIKAAPEVVSPDSPAKEAEPESEWGDSALVSYKKDKKKNKKRISKTEGVSTVEEPTTQPDGEPCAKSATESKEMADSVRVDEHPEPTVHPAAELAAAPVFETPPEEAAAGDEWGSASVTSSPKDETKKPKESASEALEPTAQDSAQVLDEPSVEPATEIIPEAGVKAMASQVPEEPAVNKAELEDEWMAGLSNKEKKQLKKAGLAAAALGVVAGAGAGILMDETPEPFPNPESVQDVKEDVEQGERQVLPAPETTELEAEGFVTKAVSRKDKKKAKRFSRLTSDVAEPASVAEETRAAESTAKEAAPEGSTFEPPESSWAEENDDGWPLATRGDAASEEPKAADETSFEAPVSGKKSKKDKKRKSGLDFASPPPEPAVEADVAISTVPAEEPTAAVAPLDSLATPETRSPALEVDEWALSAKKGKKGKKGKRQSTLDAQPESSPTEETAEPNAAQGVPATEQTRELVASDAAPELAPVEANADDLWATQSKETKVKTTFLAEHEAAAEKPLADSVIDPPTEPALDPIPSPAEDAVAGPTANPEPAPPAEAVSGEWPMPTKKKGKKGKKGKPISLADLEGTGSKGVLGSDADISSALTQPEPAAEDERFPTDIKGQEKEAKDMSFQDQDDPVNEQSSPEAPIEAQDVPCLEAITEAPAKFVEEPTVMSETKLRGDDSRSAPTKKKSKKDKKRQSTTGEITPVTQATMKLDEDISNNDDSSTARKAKRDDATTTGDERQERRSDEAVSVGEVKRDDLPDVEMTRSVDDKFRSSDSKMTTTERSKARDGGKAKGIRDSLEAVGAAAALTGGVAALTQMYGGGKKQKGKKSKIVDKRQPQENDMFDDPALWEGSEKRNIAEEPRDEAADDGVDEFWGPSRPDPGPSVAPHTPASTSFTESGDEWKENVRQGVPVGDEYIESPVLGRDESSVLQSTPGGLLRRDSKLEEPVGGLFEETPREVSSRQLYSEPSELRSSPTRGLPAVQELPEAERAAATGELWPAERPNRDSGFIPESPQRRRSPKIVDDKLRDSGVDSGDWRDSTHMQTPEAHSRDLDRRLGPSPFNTPVLHEPARDDVTTPIADPEKKLRRSKKDYGGLAAVATGATALATGAAHHDKGYDNDRRAVSESHAVASGSASVEATVPRRSVSNTSLSRQRTPEPLKLRPDSPGSISGYRSTATHTPPPLRRVDKRMSGDLRALRQQNNSTPPVANEARVRTKDMADVYDGFGEGRLGSPRSPTRPHSMRRRQSMQVLELESRVEQLVAENRLLTEARNHAEQVVNRSATSVLSERDAEIDALKQSLQYLHNEVNRLTEVNEGLTSANAELASKDNSRYTGLAAYGDGTRSLDGPEGGHLQSLDEKDAEIASLREQLEAAKEQVREMQRQILASKAGDSDFLNIQDEDYFDNRCQQLCSHVQQWVLRFSKFSDMRACRLTSEINDEKTIDRLDNSVLDGSDVDHYLNDRVKRRDIFMSMTMSMIWEFIFTRYLFGMDREQRQKLKSLEKLLTEVGPQNAVRQWRAVTLTLLAKRASFQEQRELDTEAVVQAIFQTLCKILPPPSNMENQIQSQLRRVMREAVDLSVAMRTQRAEYMMLPPLQPEYDADGELAATVQFNASMMNERSPQTKQTNEEIEADNSIVRVVLFPLVVKKGDDAGVGDEEIVVCPAQVLVARDYGRRHVTPSSEAGGASLLGAPSRLSVTTDAMLSQPDV
ncbi:involucrin repeat protein [Cordyceps militaris CM01]|uniref:Involucrin repeat protein n=1 Tax=Cordyceps militaris (strain CM01) TaxID=983644 RepID=G3JHS5_CORMM|nr:involucrin repeat protein [Cordyceps militaris CM01]EGX91781.1 involucrin repeat protein [Cordyceps militaris CM01]